MDHSTAWPQQLEDVDRSDDALRAWVAERIRRLEADGALARRAAGTRRYFVSDRVEDFARLASIFLQEDVTGEARQIELEQEILNHRLGIRNHAQ